MRAFGRNILFILIMILAAPPINASNIEGTKTYEDYIFVLVHGINATESIFKGEEPFGNLKAFLEKPLDQGGLGLAGNVFCYTFYDKNGSNYDHARELGDRDYHNPRPEMDGLCWLEKAKKDFEKNNQGKSTPSKYILITHSMGNLATRSYIYSDKVFGQGKGFYNDDIAKVVFIAPPLLGSDGVVAIMGFWGKVGWQGFNDTLQLMADYQKRMRVEKITDGLNPRFPSSNPGYSSQFQMVDPDWNEIWNILMNANADNPFYAYFAGAIIAGMDMWSDQLWKNGFGYNSLKPWWPGMIDLMPYDMLPVDGLYTPLTLTLKEAILDDPTREPSYGIVYGRGIPVCDWKLSLAMWGVKKYDESFKQNAFIPSLNYGLLSLPLLGQFPTNQGKIMSVTLAAILNKGFMTNDGDGLVPTYSARGEVIAHLKNANRYEHVFKTDHYEKYLSKQLPVEVAVIEAAIATAAGFAAMGGTPYPIAWKSFWWMRIPVALSLIDKTQFDIKGLQWDIEAHGHILEQYDLIKTAILDTPAIFTVNDLQTVASGEGGGSPEATALAFSASSAVPSGFESVKIRSVTENRSAGGTANLPVPMTLKTLSASGEGDRRYVTQMTLTKPPARIAGKLNYLVPKLMKSFEYSFNFAAWKPIEGVNPETGEFVLDNLPFAEGQNVLAIRSENAVGIKSHQLMSFTLNTIPCFPSNFYPIPNSYTNNPMQKAGVEFRKAKYAGKGAGFQLLTCEVDGVAVTPVVTTGEETYVEWMKIEVTPKEPLPDGEHRIVIKIQSDVGISQAIFPFYVDTTPPAIAIGTLEAFAARAPGKKLDIRYKSSDNLSEFLKNISVRLYKGPNSNDETNFITEIATVDTQAAGEQFVTWDGKDMNGNGVEDGNYTIKIKAYDIAGNYATSERPIVIDSTPPVIAGANVSPNPMTSKTTEFGLAARVNEKSSVIIKLNNLSNNSTTAYLTQANIAPDSNSYLSSYSWKYNDMFTRGPEDGIYDIEITARDEAGNESIAYKLEGIRIDRTPPVVYAQATLPYVLSNSGTNPYTTTLSYRMSESNDVPENKMEPRRSAAGSVRIKLYNETDHELATVWESAPNSLTETNKVEWDAKVPPLYEVERGTGGEAPKGSYKFQIIAEDDLGNQSIAYASCVKDGIAPVISFPAENGAEISGVVAIRGTAIDPDWTNSKPFKQYSVQWSADGAQWKTEGIEVPAAHRNPSNPLNIGSRPLQNDSTLAYLYTSSLPNGTYTIRVTVDEEGGESIAAARVVEVNNDAFSSSANRPYIKLYPTASEVSFRSDDSVKLPIRFLNSVKPANVHLEMTRGDRVVFYKYFPNLAGAPYIGQPSYRAGSDLGYFIWEDEYGWHIRWSSDGNNHHFTGNLIAIGGSITGLPAGALAQAGVRASGNLISWDSTNTGGFDFTITDGKQLMITPKIDEDPTSPSPYASNIYLGISKATQEFIPVMIDLENQRMMDLASMGNAGSGSEARKETRSAMSGVDWGGKLDTGAFADDGDYLIKIRAEGADGFGMATDEARVTITTPFELINVEAVNRSFSPLSAPDRVSVSYNLSKDSLVSAYVYDESNNLVSTLLEGARISGALNPNNKYSVSWRGNYPLPDSAAMVSSGRYYIKLIARAADGAGEKTEEIRDISVVPYYRNESFARLEPLGSESILNGERIRLAEGESPYYFEAKGSGLYYPPKDFNYTLTASGSQRFTTYPYVPFAALVHRGFKQVDVLAKVKITAHGYIKTDEWSISQGFYREKRGGRDQHHDKEQRFSLRDRGGPYFLEDRFTNEGIKRNWNEHEPGMEDGEFQIEIYSKDGSFLLDKTTGWINDSSGYVKTDKGMFEVKLEGSLPRGADIYDAKVYVKMPSGSEIAYSRLTNRFIPWVGFINRNHPETKDFSGYLFDIQKGLGFPGGKFFNDPDAKPATPYDSSLAASISGSGSWADKAAKLKALAEEANLLGYNDSLGSTAGYDQYLSDEYFEFIPITSPDGGELRKESDSKYTAKTDLALFPSPAPGQSQTPFVFAWPIPDFSSWNSKYGANGDNYRKLIKSAGGDPQKYDGFGSDKNVCFYELDQSEISAHAADAKGLIGLSGKTVYNKGAGKSIWTSAQSLGELLEVNNYVEDLTYSVSSTAAKLDVRLSGNGRGGSVQAEDTTEPLSWSTEQDINLSSNHGLIKSDYRLFNDEDFRGKRIIKIAEPYRVSEDYTSTPALKYTFLKYNPFNNEVKTPIDNPNVVLNNWDITVKDRNGNKNADLEPGSASFNGERLRDTFELKLKTNSSEKRYVEIKGATAGPYELSYFDGRDWKNITTSFSPKTGTLTWWNASRLNGKYTVLLRSGNYVSTQDIYIGTVVYNDGKEKDVFSAYRRAQLKFPSRAFDADKLATITPVSMTEISIRNRPIIMTHGPIVEVKPSPSKFKTPTEDGVDLRPTLKFYYTLDDLKNLGLNPDPADPTKNLGLNIHQITAAGDLQVISDNEQTYDPDNQLYCFSGPLDHFSTYTLTKGKIKLSAPIVLADRYITNKDTVTIYGTAEADSNLKVYILPNPLPLGEGGPSPQAMVGEGEPDADGRFRFDNIQLLQEGENYIYVHSSPKGNPDIKTVGEVMVVKDVTAPRVTGFANFRAFSPNGDGKWDAIEYDLATNEKGKLGFMITDPDGKMLINQELNAEKDEFTKLVWGQYGFNIYRRNSKSGDWSLMNTINSSAVFADGDYNYTAYAIDEAGNISNNVGGATLLDTTPPKVLRLNTTPNPFTPDDDGVKDTTSISYSLSELSYVTTKIYREDGQLFRKYSKTLSETGEWKWDGKGARNELLGGTYGYHIEAEDGVGNFTSSEVRSIIVDRAPSLVPYAYAEPDPFSPVNPRNNYTEIKYYLSRDNLQVQAAVIGREGHPIKNLVFGEVQNKGEHTARWYGDFVSSYDGPRASSAPNRIGDGSYMFKVIAMDQAGGKPVEVTNTVLVDNVPPRVALQPVRVDYINKKANLTYSVPEIASVEVSVHDLNGNLVELLESGKKNPGSYSLTYQEPAAKRRGSEYFKVIAVDQAKNEDERNTEAFSVVPMGELLLANVSATPSPFTPNGDVIKDQIRITYRVDGGAPEYRTGINILDPSGATVKRIIENEPQYPGTYSFYWNGAVDNPDPSIISYATDGNYSYKIAVSDQLGNLVETTGEIVLVSSQPVVNLSVDPTLISPNGDGLLDTTLINYSVDYAIAQIASPAQVRLDFLNSRGETVLTRSFSNTPGNYSFVWDGKDDTGTALITDRYTIFINVVDGLGTPAQPKSAVLDVDITNPAVNIPESPELIANPGAFSTNADPDGSDLPRQTTLYFTPTEEACVTLKVYKIGDDQTAYGVSDFNSGNCVQTLLNGVWVEGGVQQAVIWDGRIANSAQYAAPGKYAFIVEGKDRAENLTLKKWGGTVWIQNNVLTLRDTDKRNTANNPDPKYISPNGNSADAAQKRARLYFYIDLSAEPTVVARPERIEAQGVEAKTKKIGKYSVKVYTDAGLTNLIRTITSESDAWAATNTWEDWDGKGDDGRWTMGGIYYMVVDLKDYAGNPANGNLLTRQVIVDNTAPQIPMVGADNYYFSPGNSAWSLPEKDTTTISYEVTDNGAKVNIEIDILKDGSTVSALQSTTTLEANAVYYKTWDGASASADGTYTYKIKAADLAGNMAEKTGTVVVDRTRPNGTISIGPIYTAPDGTKYTKDPFVNLSLTYNDPTSGLEDMMSFSNDNLTWTAGKPLNGFENNWILPAGQGEKTVYVRYLDRAGNYGIGEINDKIVVDTNGPTNFIVTNDPAHTPTDVWSQHNNPQLSFSADDFGSGMKEYRLFYGIADQESITSPWHHTLSDGTHEAKVSAYDNVGNFSDSPIFRYMIDTTAPEFSSITVTETSLSPSWSNHNSPTFTYNAFDATSGIRSVEGKIDDNSYTSISSPWNPILTDGTHTAIMRTTDNAGKTANSSIYTFNIDTVAPTISSLTDSAFNPYLGELTKNFNVSDDRSGIRPLSTTAQVETTGGALIKALFLWAGDPGYMYKIRWDGRNDSGDYVNEGNYILRVITFDNAGNTNYATSNIVVADDLRITSSWRATQYVNISDPDISFSNGNYHLAWDAPRSLGGLQSIYYKRSWDGGVNWGGDIILDGGEADRHYELPSIFAEGSNIHVAWSRRNSADAQDLHIRYRKSPDNGDSWGSVMAVNHLPSVKPCYPSVAARSGWVYVTAHEQYTSMYEVYLYRSSDGGATWPEGTGVRITNESRRSWYPDIAPNGSNIHLIWNQDQMDTGYTRLQYCRSTDANGASWGSVRNLTLTAYSFLPYLKISENGNNLHVVLCGGRFAGDGEIEYLRSTDNGDNWAKTSFPYSGEPTIAVSGNNIHIAYANNSGVFYRRSADNGSSWSSIIKISNSSFALAPRIVANGAESYIVWKDKSPNNNYEIYGQKVPSNFAPINGTVTASMVRATPATSEAKAAIKAQTLARPVLLSPADGSTITSTIRPTIKWQGVSGVTDYQIQLNQTFDTFASPTRILSKTVTQTESNQAMAYAIHEFDNGLAAGQWYWRVLAISGTEEGESDHWSFTIDPALSLTGITNYPNPFNPNRERTAIRYRLGRQADEVKIRIYDITGALVTELDGSTNAEGVNIWSKYNDIYWDGCNGRGDKVLNGIYPFEVVARQGDRSVSGRGKIAVLK